MVVIVWIQIKTIYTKIFNNKKYKLLSHKNTTRINFLNNDQF